MIEPTSVIEHFRSKIGDADANIDWGVVQESLTLLKQMQDLGVTTEGGFRIDPPFSSAPQVMRQLSSRMVHSALPLDVSLPTVTEDAQTQRFRLPGAYVRLS